MIHLLENTFNLIIQEYGIDHALLLEYAEKGCRINHRIVLNEYISEFPSMLESTSQQEEFLNTIISIGMADTLHEIVSTSPFPKINYPKPK
ncbi:MAG: hypothetical protein KKA84_11630 [Bacteroidetes bacterium]|nr:hypothetical protein [Bacteroidota bacterium]